jgi:hypothetical protein
MRIPLDEVRRDADRAHIDWADGLVAIMDSPDPDSGTAWEGAVDRRAILVSKPDR